mgnify:CR=1 FL=1|tara:strand:+ start:8110 stop:10179 length:2070 start_codon:yes stop_codon:yes gene_type:complete
MKSIFRRWRLLATLALMGSLAGLLVYAWPFLTYPVHEISIQQSPPLAAEDLGQTSAGVAMRDITPPIGIPKFGYSSFAKDADGFRTRLKARAFYLHAPNSTPIAFVQLDLGAGSLPLHHRVAELIAAQTDVPSHGLSLLVTHTHSGPGNYLGSDFYNTFGSNRAGFDPQLFEFLSQQIAGAVIEAYQHRRPARIASAQREVWGLTRNRSLTAWARNFDIDASELNDALALRAVNPRMTMLRLDLQNNSGCYYPAGALTLFSIHGTAIPAFTSPVHGDLWSWISRDVETRINQSAQQCVPDRPFVHGAAQATHADSSPNIVNSERGHAEARRIGQAAAQQANALFDQLGAQTAKPTPTTVRVASRELDLLAQVESQRFGLCERAVVGTALIGAANGDEVFPLSYLPFFAEEWQRSSFTDGCQGVKQWMISKLQWLLPANRFPHRALLQVFQINDLVIVPLPWEITLESGNQIRAAVAETLPEGNWQIEISSLANGYFGYAVTPAEYQLQYYEGGHTLYGPHTLDFLSHQSARLSHDMVTSSESINDIPASNHFSLLSHQYWPTTAAPHADTETVTERTRRQQEHAPKYIAATEHEESYWRLRYRDVLPAKLNLHQPLLSIEQIEAHRPPQTILSDEQTDLQILLLNEHDNDASYEVRWYNPDHNIGQSTGTFRFRVAPRSGLPAFFSSLF